MVQMHCHGIIAWINSDRAEETLKTECSCYYTIMSITVKPDVLFPWILQYCWEYCNFDCEIALSKFQPTWSNCKLKFTTIFVNNVSDWLLVTKKNWSVKYSEQMSWFFFATSSQLSETLFTNLVVNFKLQFDHIDCILLRAISQSKLQYSGGTEHSVWL